MARTAEHPSLTIGAGLHTFPVQPRFSMYKFHTTWYGYNMTHHKQVTVGDITADVEIIDMILALNHRKMVTRFSCAGFYSDEYTNGFCTGYVGFPDPRDAAVFKTLLETHGIKTFDFGVANAVYWHPIDTDLVVKIFS